MNQQIALGRIPTKERSRGPDETPPFGVKHWIKTEVVALLHEGDFSVGEIALLLGEDLKRVRNHIKELYESGNIEVGGFKQVGNHKVAVYRAVTLAEISDEEAKTMTVEERHDVSGCITQGILAETVSAHRNGKLDEDPVCLLWGAQVLDEQGELERHQLLLDTWEKASKISVRTAHRLAKSGEIGRTNVIGLLGFERGRPGRPKDGYMR